MPPKQQIGIRKFTPKAKLIKATLETPYDLNWPEVSESVEKSLSSEVARVFTSLELAKPKVAACRDPELTWVEKNALKKKGRMEAWDSRRCHRQHLVIGLSAVMRSAEKGKLCALLVCRNVQPYFMVKSVAVVCSVKGIIAAAVPNLGTVLSKSLNLKSCKAVGFKKSVAENSSNEFFELYKLIQSSVPPLPAIINASDAISLSGETESREPAPKAMSGKAPKRPPDMDYSHLYIKKAAVKPIIKPAEEFISLDNVQVKSIVKPAEEFIPLESIQVKPVVTPAEGFISLDSVQIDEGSGESSPEVKRGRKRGLVSGDLQSKRNKVKYKDMRVKRFRIDVSKAKNKKRKGKNKQ